MNLVKEHKSIIPLQMEEGFGKALTTIFSAEPAWSKEKRKEAFDSFLKTGIPSRKNEQYKYSDVRKIFSDSIAITKNEFSLAPDSSAIIEDSIKITFINGRLQSIVQKENPAKGVVVASLANNLDAYKKYASSSNDPFINLNAALWTDGAFVFIPAKISLKPTIEIINILTERNHTFTNLRHLIILEENAEASVVERLIANDTEQSIINTFADIVLAENSKLHYYKLQHNNLASLVSSMNVIQHKNSFFDTHTVTLNAAWVRNNLNIQLNGTNCESHLNGLFFIGGNNHTDNHTAVLHNEPNCQSNQLYKGLLNEKATGVFNGKIYVKRDAQKTNAYQSSKNILLSDEATINTKPELEIYADDVKCSHGSSTGKIDTAALFYLRSRGLGEESARRLLLSAFVNDVLNTIRIDSFKNYVEELIEQQLALK